MDIWGSRAQSITWLQNELCEQSKTIQEGFELLGKCIDIFNRIGSNEGETLAGKFCRICAITLAKSRNFLLCCFSLTLDGLAQESGAILRPLIETYELLTFLRLDISRVDQVINDRLPSAGKIAQKISGNFMDLRKYFNDNASHFSYKKHSVRHLFNSNFRIMPLPTHSLNVFLKNLNILNAFQVFVIFEAANCLFTVGINAEIIVNEIENWRNTSKSVFPRNSDT
jgi:hypothetical protein